MLELELLLLSYSHEAPAYSCIKGLKGSLNLCRDSRVFFAQGWTKSSQIVEGNKFSGNFRRGDESDSGSLTCASSWITRYCSFQTVILDTSSFLRARSFFNSGLQNVLIEFMDELSLLSLTSTSRRSISFSRRTWDKRWGTKMLCRCFPQGSTSF